MISNYMDFNKGHCPERAVFGPFLHTAPANCIKHRKPNTICMQNRKKIRFSFNLLWTSAAKRGTILSKRYKT